MRDERASDGFQRLSLVQHDEEAFFLAWPTPGGSYRKTLPTPIRRNTGQRDLEPFDFAKILRREGRGFTLARTHENHHDASATLGDRAFDSEKERRPFETAPDGNAVILEEQMAKVAETQAAYDMAAQLYKKHLNMFKIAIGRGR